MSIMELGALGDFLGSIGVIASLLFLAVQVRRNTAETVAGSRESASTAVIDVLLRIASSEPLYKLFRTGILEPDKIPEDERFRLDMVFYSIFDMWETIFTKWKRGRMTDEDWKKWNVIIENYLAEAGVQQFWGRLSQQFGLEFRAYIDQLGRDKNYAF